MKGYKIFMIILSWFIMLTLCVLQYTEDMRFYPNTTSGMIFSLLIGLSLLLMLFSLEFEEKKQNH